MPDDVKGTCLRLMTEVLKTLKSTHEPEKVYDRVLNLVHHVFETQACAIVLIDPVTEYLKIETSYGVSHLFQKSFRKRISTGPIGSLVWDERPIVIRKSELEPDLAEQVMLEHPFGSCACLQMGADHRTVGYLYVAKNEPYDFSEEDLSLLQACADAAAIAWFKCWLVDENIRMDPVDAGTGLEKYSAFHDRIAVAMERAARFHEPFALVVGDVDNFKTISHTYGYTAAGQLLKELCGVVRSSLRPIDGAGRFGFDEFVVLRSNVGPEEAHLFAESLRASIAESLFTPTEIKTTVSLGLAIHPQNGMTIEDLLLTAKKAVFEAQRSGRNKVVVPPGVWYGREAEHSNLA